MRRQSFAVALFALVLVGSSGTAEAGIGDLIWELSGPQMVGVGINCRYDFRGKLKYCEWSPGVAGLQKQFSESVNRADSPESRWLWSWGVAGYVSTGKNNRYDDSRACPPRAFACEGNEIDYRAFDHRMLSFEPTIDYYVGDLRNARIFVSAGETFHVVWNRDAERFTKRGFKLVPIEIQTDRVTVAFNLRYYADGFGVDEFGKGIFRGGNRPSEWTKGVSVSFPLFKKR